MSLKEKMMNQMMDKQFGDMSSEDKQKMMDTMMDKFMGNMSNEEKRSMMSNMMPKMMREMMGSKDGNPMMGMMGMMGNEESEGGSNMMQHCMDMMSGIKETADSAQFATFELRNMFNEWCSQIENEICDFIVSEKEVNTKKLCEKFNLSGESISYLLSNLATKGKIKYSL